MGSARLYAGVMVDVRTHMWHGLLYPCVMGGAAVWGWGKFSWDHRVSLACSTWARAARPGCCHQPLDGSIAEATEEGASCHRAPQQKKRGMHLGHRG